MIWSFITKGIIKYSLLFFSKWRIVIIITSMVAGIYAYHTIKINGFKKSIKKLNNEIALLNEANRVITQSNAALIVVEKKLIQTNKQCVLNNLANDTATKLALTELEKARNDINKKYAILKNTPTNSVCGNTIVDIELL